MALFIKLVIDSNSSHLWRMMTLWKATHECRSCRRHAAKI